MNYRTLGYPKSRRGTFDLGIIAADKHTIASLLEINVTRARELLHRHQADGRKISFTAWFLKMIATALESHPEACAYLAGNKKILFDSISVSIMIEKNLGGHKVPLPLLIENMDAKSIDDIYEEIEKAKNAEVGDDGGFVLNKTISSFLIKLYFNLPQFLRIFLVRRILKNPFSSKKMMGNVIFTSIKMEGNVSGWFVPRSYHNLCFALGSVSKKPCVADGEIRVGEIAHLTVLFDHDVIDGSPFARFVSDLVKLLENPVNL